MLERHKGPGQRPRATGDYVDSRYRSKSLFFRTMLCEKSCNFSASCSRIICGRSVTVAQHLIPPESAAQMVLDFALREGRGRHTLSLWRDTKTEANMSRLLFVFACIVCLSGCEQPLQTETIIRPSYGTPALYEHGTAAGHIVRGVTVKRRALRRRRRNSAGGRFLGGSGGAVGGSGKLNGSAPADSPIPPLNGVGTSPRAGSPGGSGSLNGSGGTQNGAGGANLNSNLPDGGNPAGAPGNATGIDPGSSSSGGEK